MEVQEIGPNGSPGFVELPMEIIFNIFRYLNFGDIQSASLASRRLGIAAQHSEFRSKLLLKFKKIHLSEDSFPGNLFLNTVRPFPNIYLLGISVGNVQNLFSRIGSTVEHIVFDDVKITENQFRAILKEIPNVRALSIIGPLSKAREFLNLEADRKLLAASLMNLREITIKKNVYLTKAILHCTTSLTPNLERMTMTNDAVEFFVNIIENHVTTLKEVHLNDAKNFTDFLNMANIKGLDLRKISFKSLYSYSWRHLETFLKSQKNLVEINLSGADIMGSCIELICDHLTKVEILKIKYCKILSSVILGVLKLKSLRVFDISFCGIVSFGVQQGIAKVKNHTLLELYLSDNLLSESCLIQCVENFPNLQVFDISHCRAVTDKVVQAIIKNLTRLRFLSLNGCYLITDTGLTGTNVKDQISSQNALNQVDNLTQGGLSIKQIKGLKTLKLGMRDISDVSLKYGLQFLELKNLNLYSCKKISVIGIQALVENCPSIEMLDLSYCPNINKECIEVISQRLQRLQFLDIRECKQLIDHIEYIVINCKVPRVLKMFFYNEMCPVEKLRQSGVKISRNLCLIGNSRTLVSLR